MALALWEEFEAANMIDSNGRIRRAQVPADAVIHPNFRGRPDARIYSNIF